MTHTGTMHVAGVVATHAPPPQLSGVFLRDFFCVAIFQFNGDLDKGKAPVRADIPSFWDGFEIGSYLGGGASALDVGVSAVYSIGAMAGGPAGGDGSATLEARRYAHRSLPHVVGVDFTFNNSGTATLLSNISQPGSWGGSAPTLSTKDTAWAHSSGLADGVTCWTGSVAMSEDPSLPLIHLALCATDLRSAPLLVSVPAGQTKTYSVLASIYSTLDHPSPLVPAQVRFHANVKPFSNAFFIC